MATINVEWLNQNSQRAFPFQENMQLRPTIDGVVIDRYRIPNETILDLVITTNFDTQPEIYLSALTISNKIVTAVISDVSDDKVLAVASAVQGDSDTNPINFTGYGKHDDIRGTIVFGNLNKVSEKIPDGTYEYQSSETKFEARCVRPSIPCVSGLYLTNISNSYESIRLRGDVALIAGDNIRLDFDEENNAIIINADANYEFNDKCGCEQKDNRTEIKTINGISINDVIIEGDGSCVNVETVDGRIKISDTCSKPCCGCAELTFLNQKTNEIITTINKLDSFSQTLNSKLQDFVTNVLLSDRSSMKYI